MRFLLVSSRPPLPAEGDSVRDEYAIGVLSRRKKLEEGITRGAPALPVLPLADQQWRSRVPPRRFCRRVRARIAVAVARAAGFFLLSLSLSSCPSADVCVCRIVASLGARSHGERRCEGVEGRG